jgi:hypothetical protein
MLYASYGAHGGMAYKRYDPYFGKG